MIPARCLQNVNEPILEGEPESLVIRRVFGFRIDADRPPDLVGFPLGEGNDLLERRDLEPTVERLAAVPERLHRPEGLDSGQREIAREKPPRRAVDDGGAPPTGEFRPVFDVGRINDVRFVPGDERPVLRGERDPSR